MNFSYFRTKALNLELGMNNEKFNNEEKLCSLLETNGNEQENGSKGFSSSYNIRSYVILIQI